MGVKKGIITWPTELHSRKTMSISYSFEISVLKNSWKIIRKKKDCAVERETIRLESEVGWWKS